MIGTLVLLRHGESTWNQENLFTGWHDVPLSDKGEAEAAAAGATMAAEGLWFDTLHTSLLTRAVADRQPRAGDARPALAARVAGHGG